MLKNVMEMKAFKNSYYGLKRITDAVFDFDRFGRNSFFHTSVLQYLFILLTVELEFFLFIEVLFLKLYHVRCHNDYGYSMIFRVY